VIFHGGLPHAWRAKESSIDNTGSLCKWKGWPAGD
jgi:hypothetical protein